MTEADPRTVAILTAADLTFPFGHGVVWISRFKTDDGRFAIRLRHNLKPAPVGTRQEADERERAALPGDVVLTFAEHDQAMAVWLGLSGPWRHSEAEQRWQAVPSDEDRGYPYG